MGHTGVGRFFKTSATESWGGGGPAVSACGGTPKTRKTGPREGPPTSVRGSWSPGSGSHPVRGGRMTQRPPSVREQWSATSRKDVARPSATRRSPANSLLREGGGTERPQTQCFRVYQQPRPGGSVGAARGLEAAGAAGGGRAGGRERRGCPSGRSEGSHWRADGRAALCMQTR